jgi:hypothetical protein
MSEHTRLHFPEGNIQVYNLPRPPRVMRELLLDAAIQKDILSTARKAQGAITSSGTHNYYIFGYIGSNHYCFEFSRNNNHDNIIQRDDTVGCLVIHVEAIPWDGDLPINGVNNGTMIQ